MVINVELIILHHTLLKVSKDTEPLAFYLIWKYFTDRKKEKKNIVLSSVNCKFGLIL